MSGVRVVVLQDGSADPVSRLLAGRARRWSERVADPGEVRGEAEGLGFATILRDVDPDEGRVIIIAPVLPQWPDELAAAALSDLDAGCALALGPIFDGGFYLIALAAPVPGLAELSDDELDGRRSMATLIELAGAAGVEVGLLRTQRGLRNGADERALSADPLTDPELRELLR